MIYTVVNMDDHPDDELPASIAAAWGRARRPTKGPSPGLGLDRIVAAGLRVAQRDGLAAVSMARVAQELGASTMSLYRYVGAKDELLDLMVDTALGRPPAPAVSGDGWRPALERWAWTYHERLREHPWALRIPIKGPPVAPNGVAWLEAGLHALAGTGLDDSAKASTILLLSGYVRSEATLTADLVAAGLIDDAAMVGYSRTLRSLADPDRFPAINAVLDSGVFDRADDPDDEFAFGLERIFAGVQALIDSIRSSRRPRARRPR